MIFGKCKHKWRYDYRAFRTCTVCGIHQNSWGEGGWSEMECSNYNKIISKLRDSDEVEKETRRHCEYFKHQDVIEK